MTAGGDGQCFARTRLVIFLVFLALCFAGGGGSREDIMSLLYLRPAAALCLVAMLALPGRIDFEAIKVPLWLLGALTIWIACQLVPLPPDLWTALPGREPIARGAEVIGIAQPWRPISISPYLTLNSLAAMIIPFTALIGFAGLTPDQRRMLLPILIGVVAVSALFGIAQVSGGQGSAFYLYRITNADNAVGLFANRNHQAALLAMAFPMLGLWAAQGAPWNERSRLLTSALCAAVLVVMLLVSGSRAGLLLGAAAAFAALFNHLELRRAQGRRVWARWKSLIAALAVTGIAGTALAVVSYRRAEALHRLFGEQMADELRVLYFPYMLDLARTHIIAGSGFGSFDPLFRIGEPFEYLTPSYFNHAHNDLLELAITGGLPALLLLVLFVVWVGRQALLAFRRTTSWSQRKAFAQLGAVLIGVMLAASLVDYPLRTPIMAALLAIACGWLGSCSGPGERDEAQALRSG